MVRTPAFTREIFNNGWLAARICAAVLLVVPASMIAQDTRSGSPVEQSQELSIQLQAVAREVARIESESGPFDRRLLEPLSTLVRLNLENEDRANARALLDQQLQILRISDGLYSVAQIPIIETILELATQYGDWQQSNDSLQYLSWLYQRDTTLSPEEKLSGMRKISEWHLLALGKDVKEREAYHLLEMAKTDERISEIAEQLYGGDSVEIVPYIYNQALADAYIALAITITFDTSQELLRLTEGISNRPNLLSGIGSTSLRTTADVEAMYGSRASTVIERSFKNNMNKHFEKLERIKDIYSQAGDAEAEAMALMYLGDSLLIRQQFENRPGEFAGIRRGTSSAGTAMSHYRDALAALAEAGIDEADIKAYTACPVLLPMAEFEPRFAANKVQCQRNGTDEYIDLGEYNLVSTFIPGIEGTLAQDESAIAATVEFEVRANGQVSRKNIIEISPDDTSNRVQIRKLLEITQFRPAIIDGAPVRTERIRMQINIPLNE